MTKEEKKAYKILKYQKILVDKQQKEIEELYEVLEEWINGERYNDIFYISKDKIREKIKELERLNKEQEISVLKEYKFIRKEMIDYFKKLIGEE